LAQDNNLKVNPAKYSEVVFYDKSQKVRAPLPPSISQSGIKRSTAIKIFGVTERLNILGHVGTVVNSCADNALKVMRANGMHDDALQVVNR